MCVLPSDGKNVLLIRGPDSAAVAAASPSAACQITAAGALVYAEARTLASMASSTWSRGSYALLCSAAVLHELLPSQFTTTRQLIHNAMYNSA